MVHGGFRDVGHAAFSSFAFTPGDHVMRAHREAAVVAHRLQLLDRHAGLEHQQAAQLPVAVLLDDEVHVVRLEELPRPRRRTGSRGRACSRARCRPAASRSSASMHAAWQPPTVTSPSFAPGVVLTIGAGTALRRALDLAIEAIDDLDVLVGVFGVAAELVVARAAREVRALRVHARQRPVRDAVAVDVEVAVERLHAARAPRPTAPCRGRAGSCRPTSASGPSSRSCRCRDRSARTPASGSARRDRRTSTANSNASRGSRGIEADVPRVAVRRVGAQHQVALLRARRHAGRRTGALHVEDHRRDLGVVGQADELVHQRDARTRRRRERARAGPRRADHHADRGELVLGLQDGEAIAASSPARGGTSGRSS